MKMKKYDIPLYIIALVCFGMFLFALDYLVGEQFSKQQVENEAVISHLDDRAEQVEKYSRDLLDVIKSLSHENTLLCERDAKTLQVVAEFEDENRRLKCSLSDAVTRLEDQQTEINSLIDQNFDLEYKVEVLEKALDALNPAVKSLSHENTILCERDVKTFQVVAEDEDRRLRCSLCYAVTRLQELQTETDSLIDQNFDLENKIGVLDKALDDQQTKTVSLIDQNFDLEDKISVLDKALDDQQTKTSSLIHQNKYRDYDISMLEKALDDQQTETDSLIHQTDDLRYKVEVLEKALDALNPIVK